MTVAYRKNSGVMRVPVGIFAWTHEMVTIRAQSAVSIGVQNLRCFGREAKSILVMPHQIGIARHHSH